MLALVDCENFYVSCERVFDPQLRARPVVVLSNNDGCVISRSNEAKAVGIRMGAPIFQAREVVEGSGVEVRSSNYVLYGDMSRRVMETLGVCAPRVEQYSIDEAFVEMPESVGRRELCEAGHAMRERVRKWTGIPVSVGIARTKTLAKLASRLAKSSAKAQGVVNLADSRYLNEALARVSVGDVWGIGPNRARVLRDAGMETALDLSRADEVWIRRRIGVVGVRIVWELRGTSCLPLESCPRPKKSLVVSRSFGRPVGSVTELREAVAHFISKASEKLRRAQLAAGVLTVFLNTNRFRDEPQSSPSVTVRLSVPTDLTPELIRHAQEGLERIYRSGYRYKKAGVMLFELVPASPCSRGCSTRLTVRVRAAWGAWWTRLTRGWVRAQCVFSPPVSSKSGGRAVKDARHGTRRTGKNC